MVRGNSKTFFIAAMFHNSELILRAFVPHIMELIDILGPERVLVSILENGADCLLTDLVALVLRVARVEHGTLGLNAHGDCSRGMRFCWAW